jgi:lysophospholipase L1-like esterase
MRRLLLVALVFACARHAAPPPLHDGVFRVAIVGDSVAHGAGDESGRGIAGNLDALLGGKHLVTNLGINGARTWNVLLLLQRPIVADAIVLSIGGNDLYGDSIARFTTLVAPTLAMERTIDRIATIVAAIHHENPSTRVVLLGLYDPYATPFLDEQVAHWDARLIERFAHDRAVDVVRIADVVRVSPLDHFHPGAAGYAAIASRIAPALGAPASRRLARDRLGRAAGGGETPPSQPPGRRRSETPASAAPSLPARTRTRT